MKILQFAMMEHVQLIINVQIILLVHLVILNVKINAFYSEINVKLKKMKIVKKKIKFNVGIFHVGTLLKNVQKE
jgi:hypothetical protein